MITIKLQEVSGNGYQVSIGEGKVKYVQKPDDYPIELGERLCFKWHKPWVVLGVWKTKKREGEKMLKTITYEQRRARVRLLEGKAGMIEGMLRCMSLMPSGIFGGCSGCDNDRLCGQVKRVIEADIKRAYDNLVRIQESQI